MDLDEPSLVRNWMNSTTYRPMSAFAPSEINASLGRASFMILMTGLDQGGHELMTQRQDTYSSSLGARDQCQGCGVYISEGLRGDQSPADPPRTMRDPVLGSPFPALGAGVSRFGKFGPILLGL